MAKTAVIVDSRLSNELTESIEKHMKFLKQWNLVHIVNKEIKTFFDYQRFFLSIDFWTSLKTDKVLIFQKDSEILRPGIEEFWELDYSYIGAPWVENAPWGTTDRRGGNGGISIRNVDAHIETLRSNDVPEIVELEKGKGVCEDVWFSRNLRNVAPYEVCKKFSVEAEFQLGTVCAHAIDRHLSKDECYKIRTQYLI